MSVAIPSLRGAIAVPEWAKNELWRKSRVVPSLDLRFADLKSLVDATTGTNLVTFTRGSGGAYVGSDRLIKTATTNEPRFTHDPVTGESLGLLVEEQRTNLLLRSEEFDSASWAKNNGCTITTNDIASPSGTLTADRFNGAALTSSGVYAFPATVSGQAYTFSVYIKNSLAATAIRLGFESNPSNAFVTFNAVTGTITSAAANVTSSSVQSVGDGWHRVAMSCVATDASAGMVIYSMTGAAATWYLWGAQLEAGSFPTSYIKNIDNPLGATRAADVVSISGSNFSSWYRQDEGTVFWEGNPFASTETGYFGVQSASSASFVRLSRAFNQARSVVAASTVNQADIYSGNTITLGANNKIATAIKANDFALSLAGGTIVTDTSGIMPTVDRATIGTGAFLSQLNGAIRRITYWPQRLPNSTLQAITL